jgi:CRP-like cAMP-binding protein
MQFLGSLIGRGRDSAAQLPPVTAKKLVAEMPADEARDSRWSGVGQVDDGDWDDDECGSQGGEAGSPHGSPPGSPSAQRGGRSVDVARAAVNDDDDDDGDGGNGPILGGLGAATRPVRQEGCAREQPCTAGVPTIRDPSSRRTAPAAPLRRANSQLVSMMRRCSCATPFFSRLSERQSRSSFSRGGRSSERARRDSIVNAVSEHDVDMLESLSPELGWGGSHSAHEDAFLTEQCTAQELRCLLLPFSRSKRLWDGFTLALVVYTALVLPYVLGFTDGQSWVAPAWIGTIDIVADLAFMVDIVLNFFTGYVREVDATLVTDKRQIARHYLAGWFWIDAPGSVPWEIIGLITEAAGGAISGTAGGIQIVKILKVPKLLRLSRLLKFLNQVASDAANLGRIFVVLVLFMLTVHWLASGFYLIAGSSAGWMGRRMCAPLSDDEMGGGDAAGAASPPAPGGGGGGGGMADSYLDADGMAVCVDSTDQVYVYAITYYYTLLVLMGDGFEPTSAAETIFAIFVVIIGACVNATIFANVASLVAQITAPFAAHQARVDSIDRAMRQMVLDPKTSRQIRGYYHYRWTRHRDHAGDSFIQSLPYQLRTRTSCLVHEAMIRKCPLYSSCERKFIAALSTRLIPEVYLPAQFIVIAGYVSRAMFFIRRGRVQIIRKVSQNFFVQECHDFFDVLSLFTDRQHTISVRSVTHTDLYKLEREAFEAVVRDYPGQGVSIAGSASDFLKPQHAAIAAQKLYELAGVSSALKHLQVNHQKDGGGGGGADAAASKPRRMSFSGDATKRLAKRIKDLHAASQNAEPEEREEELQRHRNQITADAQARRLRDVCARGAAASSDAPARTSALTLESLHAHNLMHMSSAQAAQDAGRRRRRLSSASIDSDVSAVDGLEVGGGGEGGGAGEKKRRTSSGSVCSITEGHEAGFSIDGTRRASLDPATARPMLRRSFTDSSATFNLVPSPQASPAAGGRQVAWQVPATPTSCQAGGGAAGGGAAGGFIRLGGWNSIRRELGRVAVGVGNARAASRPPRFAAAPSRVEMPPAADSEPGKPAELLSA